MVKICQSSFRAGVAHLEFRSNYENIEIHKENTMEIYTFVSQILDYSMFILGIVSIGNPPNSLVHAIMNAIHSMYKSDVSSHSQFFMKSKKTHCFAAAHII